MEPSLHRFRVHTFDADAFGIATAPRLLSYLVEAAGASADALGFGMQKLQDQGLTWVLGRIRIMAEQRLVVGDDLEIETWPAGLERSVAKRDFRILRGGHAVGCATSAWFVLDTKTRAPVRPQKVLPERLHPQTPHPVELSRTIAPLCDPSTLQRCFDVRKADIDRNRHVTAASYVAWAIEALPDELWREHRLASLDIQFMEECHLGSTVLSESTLVGEASVLHRISRQDDGKELARLSSLWSRR